MKLIAVLAGLAGLVAAGVAAPAAFAFDAKAPYDASYTEPNYLRHRTYVHLSPGNATLGIDDLSWGFYRNTGNTRGIEWTTYFYCRRSGGGWAHVYNDGVDYFTSPTQGNKYSSINYAFTVPEAARPCEYVRILTRGYVLRPDGTGNWFSYVACYDADGRRFQNPSYCHTRF